MTNSARLSGRPSSSAAYNVGDVVDTPDSAIKSWRYLGAGEWEPNDAVRYTTSPGGGIIQMSAEPLRRRAMFPKNLETPFSAYSKQQTLGTVTDTPSIAHPVRCEVTATGTTGRVFGIRTITLDTGSYYEAGIKVTGFSVTDFSQMAAAWFGIGSTPTEGVMQLKINETPPVVGGRIAIRFRPSAESTAFRFGFGINAGEKVTAGDVIEFEDFYVYRIASLGDAYDEFSYSAHGRVGRNIADPALPGSCVIALGDSWSNDSTDWPTVFGNAYDREMVVSALAGRTLEAIKTAFDELVASGASALNRPARHVPGVAVIVGGINDIVQDAAASVIHARAQSLIDVMRTRYIRPLFVVQPLATNAASYSATRLAARNALARYLKGEGCDVLDLHDHGFINADGTANTTWMLDETGAWIHPTSAGSVELARLIDARIRDMDRAAQHIVLSPRWQI